MDRIAAKAIGDHRLTVPTNNQDGTAVTATTPALSIVDGAGVAVPFGGTPTASAGSIYADVPGTSLDALDVYTLSWTGTVAAVAMGWTSIVDVAGGYLFEVAEFRASDTAMADTLKYPAAAVRAARTAAELRFERLANVAFVPRGARVRVIGTGGRRVRVFDNAIRRVVSASIAGVALTADELAALTPREWGAIDRPSGSVWTDGAEIEIYYEHGEDFPPDPVRHAVMLLAKEYLVRKALGSRATVETTDVGTFALSIADRQGSTGVPEVDAVASPEAFGRRPPRIG